MTSIFYSTLKLKISMETKFQQKRMRKVKRLHIMINYYFLNILKYIKLYSFF